MKVTMEVDCTPEEARRFLGLPDVAPLQAAAMERMQARMAEAASATSPDALLRAWLPLMPQIPEALLRALRGAAGPGPDKPGG
ncbi:DUF6489 family protein [Falsiroseomonas sp. HW251]|uniref:DUF6489 family protein n=1 Tax=Falsiroseomonas sp. HW251 TaxID=3390998 RepID=UPI003D311DF5